jgi:hypothetical protein
MQSDHRIRKRHWSRRRATRVRTAAVQAWPYRRVPRSRTVTDPPDAKPGPPARQSLRLAALVVANANYLGVALVNICIAVNTWYLTKGIIDARGALDRVCFVAGGTAGALLAVLLT